MPTPMKISGRSSSITNAFINSIIPVILPTAEEVKQALDLLGMTPETFQCAYCGGIATEWDHLRPLVKNKKPTGYISEICNLVPSCGKCNQSKGNKDWKSWMLSGAELSPSARGIIDIETRIKRLEVYENYSIPTQINFEAIVGVDLWSKHWMNWERMLKMMREAQETASIINRKVAEAIKGS
jgi:hypothetical protein